MQKNYGVIIFLVLLVSCILVTSISHAVASQSFKEKSREVAYSDSDYDEVLAILNEHYNAIASRDFETAYYLRSSTWRANHSYNWFLNNWKNNVTIELLNMNLISVHGDEAVAKIRTYSEDENARGKVHSAYYRGKVYLVYENGWKIDDVQVSEE